MRNGPPCPPRPTATSSLPRHATAWQRVGVRSRLAAVGLALAVVGCAGASGARRAGVGRERSTQGASSPARSVPAENAPAADGGAEAHRRADAATEALVQHFWSGDARTFVMTPGGAQADYWLAAEAFDAVLDGVERTGGARWADVARAFVAGQEARGWGREFFDDENWMALALIRASDLTGDASALARAQALLDDIMTNAWDRDAGGVWWDRKHSQKATASNAGPVITAARLYERTGDPRLLSFARTVFAHWVAEMVDPTTAQVADHLEPTGDKVWWRFTYNEGAMIGAALALHHATGEGAYLATARRIASFMLAHETTATSSGPVLSDGPRCDGDCEQFKGIGQRYLAALAEADPYGGWGALVASSAAAVWDLDREPASTTFGVDWAARSGAVTVATQSSATMALDRAARLAARSPR